VSKLYNPACHQVIPRSAKVRQIRQKDKVERHFVWSPVSWFPTLSLRYKSVEGLSGYDGRAQLSTCERTVQVVVCDRPRFVAPSPLGVEGHLMTLANTDIVFTVAALDRNQDDVVEIVTDQVLDSSAVQLGPNVYDEKLLVTGLEITSRNRVSRLVRWSVPNDGISHKLCFRARDNQFPCGDGGGLVSEDTLCVHCALEPLGVYTTCSSTLTAENLDLRLPPIICGDGRITDTEQCDDDNSLSGDGCSSLCTLEPGYHQVDPDPRPKYTCGDGLVVRGESCDDMNTQDSDGCSDTCQTEFGFTCLECGEKTECLPTCGDSILASNVHRNETCDNVAGCSSQCR
jgi:cysteine-rich repeat protein